MKYGARSLKIESEDGVWYMPFDGERYRDLLISVKVDVGSSTLWGEAQTLATLDGLLDRQIITPLQYLKRLPHGIIPGQQSLLCEIKEAQTASSAVTEEELIEALPPAYRERWEQLSEDTRRRAMAASLQ